MIPSRLLLKFLLIWLLTAIVISFFPGEKMIWLVSSLIFLTGVLIDASLVLTTALPSAKRTVLTSLPVGIWHDVKLRLTNSEKRTIQVSIFDHCPAHAEYQNLPQTVTIPARGWVEITYKLRPLERGEHYFDQTQIRLSSPLNFWERQKKIGERSGVRIYPNFAAITKYALFAIDNRLSQLGILQKRRRGEGLDFHQLREYREGDSLRSIDWKATSRTAKLIAREYQDERDQQVMFLIDCGRRMSTKDGELSHFDHALNAVLLLSYVSLRQGDAVGLLTMGGQPRYSAPRKSAVSVNVILNTLYDLQPSLATSDYYRAALDLSNRLRKRALIVIISNLRDEDDYTLLPALKLLSRKHLVLFASLRESVISDVLNQAVITFDQALAYAASMEYLATRATSFRRLEHGGALCLDVEPEKLPVALVNRYLEVKGSGIL